jgi:8-oxo-dGTP pyrophosphatase MutT (NUDIX family)
MKITRKVLVIPYVPSSGRRKTRFLVAKDRASGEWTFFSGTCEAYEVPIRCALRELYEETKGLLQLSCLPTNTHHCRIWDRQQQKDKRVKRVDVFFVPLSMESVAKMKDLVADFDVRQGDFPKEFFENDIIRFQTLAQFKANRRIWSYIKRMMYRKEFRKIVAAISP